MNTLGAVNAAFGDLISLRILSIDWDGGANALLAAL